MNIRFSFVLNFTLLCILASCKNNPASSNSIPTGDENIYGYVYLLDSLKGQDISPRDFSSVQISIPGGSQYTSTTIDGQYELQNVPTSGAFTLVFSKPGFAEHHDASISFSASTGSFIEYYNTVLLYQIRQLTPDIVLRPFQSLSGADTPRTVATFTSRIIDSLQTQEYSGYIKLYFSKNPSIVPTDAQSFQYALPLIGMDAESGISTIGVFRDSLLNNGFSPSDNIYCTAYYCGFYTKNEFYIDKASGKRIYTGLSPFHSETRSFIVP